MLTALVVTANLLGIGVALLLVTIAIPEPSIVRDTPRWLTFGVVPGYVLLALALGSYALTRQTVQALRWAIEGRKPTREEERRTFLAPWRVAVGHLMFWGVGTALLTTLYGLINNAFIPRFLFAVSFCGVLVATATYLHTEFALRPFAAQALEAGPPPRRLAPGILGRTMVVWLLGSGVPVVGIALMAMFEMVLLNLTRMQFATGVLIISMVTLVFGFIDRKSVV